MKSFVDDDINQKPGKKKTSSQFPLNATQAIFYAIILFQYAMPEKTFSLGQS
jgi:hypothetical protein